MECGGKVAFGDRDTALAEARCPSRDAQQPKRRRLLAVSRSAGCA